MPGVFGELKLIVMWNLGGSFGIPQLVSLEGNWLGYVPTFIPVGYNIDRLGWYPDWDPTSGEPPMPEWLTFDRHRDQGFEFVAVDTEDTGLFEFSISATFNDVYYYGDFGLFIADGIEVVASNGVGAGGGRGDVIYGGNGGQVDDHLSGLNGADVIYGGEGEDQILGGTGNDVLLGGGQDDYMRGGSGNDRMLGEDGNDVMHGDAGNDFLYGGEGDDILTGGAGNDRLVGGAGVNELSGGSGDDFIYAGNFGDTLIGSTGNDALMGGNGLDRLVGGAGDDFLNGGAGNDTLVGGTEDDELFGSDGADNLNAGSGDDYLDGGTGNDKLRGGEGADVFFFRLGDGRDVIFDFEIGVDSLQLSWVYGQKVTIASMTGRDTDSDNLLDATVVSFADAAGNLSGDFLTLRGIYTTDVGDLLLA